ncbi:MAG: NAD(P)/FAD-dependent oxidoreductase, partial [Hyphomicrobiales bacterium]
MNDKTNGENAASYDLAVIGAASAGFSAAITAADEGAQVALIGHGTIGGTCVNVGCVPSKALIRVAETVHIAQKSSRFDGITASARVTSWQAVVRQKQSLVDDLRKAKYSDLLPSYNSVAYLEGKAAFSDDGNLAIDGKPLKAGKIIIATGTRPALPSISGIEDVPYLTSTTALELETLPASMIIIGAGYIGAEISQIFARVGVRVTLVSRRGLLPEAEPEIGEALTGYFEDEGITVVSGISYERIESRGETINLHVNGMNGPEVIEAEKVMIASGRTPNTDELNLAAAGIETLANAGVKIDAQMRTTREGVYAAGDVTGNDQFVYMAAYGAKIAAKNAMNSNSLSYDNT